MPEQVERAVAVVGVGAVLPDAPNASVYWENLKAGRYSISEVPADRWDPSLYYDADPKAPDKTYSTIGGWVQDVDFSPLDWRMPIPPKVSAAMDPTQKWSITASREALLDYGYPDRPLDPDRTAVVLGNAMAGEMHYLTALRAYFPEYAEELNNAPAFAALDPSLRKTILDELLGGVRNRFPNITEDTMPGELGNIIAGRVANLYNFHGPNFIVDAACASALAAIDAAIEGLEQGDYDAVLTGGIDANMGVPSFIKFCKIGALSATGTRPYHDGADGFVMGEGAAVFLLKRLTDAERDGDRIYAVIRGLGGSSDGRGKGITAPNPVGQEFAIARAWRNAKLVPNSATYIEGHGTSTRVGDVVEAESLSRVFADLDLRPGSIALGSVKSNIGHLKSAAGAAGMLKAVMSLDEKVLAPSLGGDKPNPNIDFSRSPLYINKELNEWKTEQGQVRTAAVSAFGFGGTNFHVVLEEYVPGRLEVGDQTSSFSITAPTPAPQVSDVELKAPLRGALVVGAATIGEVRERLESAAATARDGGAPPPEPPHEADLRAEVRVAIDYGDAAELAAKAEKAIKAIDTDSPTMWKALRNQGIFLGVGNPGMVAFLYTGQGSQYVNMLDTLRKTEPIVANAFAEADRIMEPVLGKPLSGYIFADPDDQAAMQAADLELRQTEITQPAVLTVDDALTDLLAAYGIQPDMVMGHSLGEYGALVAAGALPFEDALEAVAGRGREMASVEVEDNGLMAAVFAPLDDVVRITEEVGDYVVVANYNSTKQAVIGGSSAGVAEASRRLQEAGAQVIPLPVSHAFHTEIVAPAAIPLTELLERLRLESPAIPIVANIDGEFYPMGPNVVPKMIDILGRQIASPVQFVHGLETLYEAGCRIFVEVGPKKALHGLAGDVLGDDSDVITLFTNHPKLGDRVSFNHGLCGLYAAGLGVARPTADAPATPRRQPPKPVREHRPPPSPAEAHVRPAAATAPVAGGDVYSELGHLFAEFLEKGAAIYGGAQPAQREQYAAGVGPVEPEHPVVVTGAGLGLPGGERVFGDGKIPDLLQGKVFIDSIPMEQRERIANKHITRLVKSEAGGGRFERIESESDVIKLAGRGGAIDLAAEYGFPEERAATLDRTSKLAIGAGLDALRDAGIPLVMRYKDTTTGTKLRDRWMLPEEYQATTGVIFASAFPGSGVWAEEAGRYYNARAAEDRLAELRNLAARIDEAGATPDLAAELQRRVGELETEIEQNGYTFDRKFLYRALSFAHAQFAEYIGAKGPNTQVNAACASTTQAVAIAEDWIRTGRCDRVVIISGDDVTSDQMLEWIGAGFLTMGAAATDERVEDAAVPFDRRRHGLILGMGAAAIVVEHRDSVSARGLEPIAEVLATHTANSAFHGSRLDPEHICHAMEALVADAERRWGIDRHEIAASTVFVSHETYTPARGGSAQAEIDALRFVFGPSADQIVISNTKGYTGHAMGVGVEDVLAIKAMETGVVPPVPNYKEPDPDLGELNLARGGDYPIQYALRLGAGFGSQISLTLYRDALPVGGVRPAPDALGYENRIADSGQWSTWLASATGLADAKVEIEKRTLRVRDNGEAPPAAPVATQPTTASDPVVEESVPVAAAVAVDPVGDVVADRVLELVSEQTGYPPDMLDLDLDLEADLGVDTVKQAETFAAIREEYGIERDDNLALRDYPTLNDVIGFVHTKRPDLAAPTAGPAPAPLPDGPVGDPVTDRVLELVSDQTGYPPDMLDPELDLEADLGIDTVKQAETFAAIREEYGIERDDNLALRDYPTLNDVIGFVHTKRPDLAGDATGTAPQRQVDPADSVELPSGLVAGDDDAAAAIPRRIPTPFLRPSPEQCLPSGVALDGNSRLVVMLDEGGVGRALLKRLNKRGAATLAIADSPDADDLRARLDEFSKEGRITGVYWLAGLDVEPPIADLDLDQWREGLRRRVKLLYETMRHLYDVVGEAGSFLVSATRLGGLHGYGTDGATAPMGGAVTGFTKAFKREKPAAQVKAVDFPNSRKTAALADALIEETLIDPGAVEIGRQGGHRWTIGITEQELPEVPTGIELGADSVFVVTGAAGSIVSAITADLAGASGGTFHLLDLTPEPDRSDPDIAAFATDRDGLKRTIFDRLKAAGEKATPAIVERQLAEIERRHAALSTIQAVERFGGTAVYHSVNLMDASAVGAAMERIREDHGRVDVLLHAAGLEISRLLPDKERKEYDLVFDVKADGWFNLVKGLGDTPIRSAVVFSSVAGRFGNNGQSDYSAANDLLCKFVSSLRTGTGGTLGVALDWTAWGDIGMATRGSIPTVMKAAGIDMLPAAAGIPIVRREITMRAHGGEMVVGKRLGVLMEEFHPTGGFDTSSRVEDGQSVMLGSIGSFGVYGGLRAAVELDPAEQPFLFDHQIDGTPVLPGVMGVEAFATAARAALPGRSVAAIEDVNFLAPFKFYRSEPRSLTVEVRYTVDGEDIIGDCELIGVRTLANQEQAQRTVHFTGRVRLADEAPGLSKKKLPPRSEVTANAENVYAIYFHGPAYQVIDEVWRNGDAVVGAMAADLPSNHEPAEQRLATTPRLTELAFQAAGVWEIGTTGTMALPLHIGRVVYGGDLGKAKGGLHAVVHPGDDNTFDAFVLDSAGTVYVAMSGYKTVQLPVPIDADTATPLRRAMNKED